MTIRRDFIQFCVTVVIPNHFQNIQNDILSSSIAVYPAPLYAFTNIFFSHRKGKNMEICSWVWWRIIQCIAAIMNNYKIDQFISRKQNRLGNSGALFRTRIHYGVKIVKEFKEHDSIWFRVTGKRTFGKCIGPKQDWNRVNYIRKWRRKLKRFDAAKIDREVVVASIAWFIKMDNGKI